LEALLISPLQRTSTKRFALLIAPRIEFSILFMSFIIEISLIVYLHQVYDFLASAGAKFGVGFWKPGSGQEE
jgi:hypothetical protein